MIAATAWTWEYIDEFLTIPRLNALLTHWSKVPPVAKTAALYAGIMPAASNVTPIRPAGGRITNADIVRDTRNDPRTLQWQTVKRG